MSILFIVTFETCRKVEENNLKNGEWRIVDFRFNRDTGNALRLFLPGFTGTGSCCKYILNFSEENILTCTYFVNDTLAYTKFGEWELHKKDEIRLVFDDFVNGNFELNKLDNSTFNLISDDDSNYVQAIDSVKRTTIRIRRSAN